MIVDSSALIAVLFDEPERSRFLDLMLAHTLRMSVANHLETAIVVDARRDPTLSRRFDDLVRELRIELVPVTRRQGELARAACRDYGKARHPAGLNFGDCLAFALAEETGEPLLYKGDDFARAGMPEF